MHTWAQVIGNGESQAGTTRKVDVTLNDRHIDTRIKICIIINVIVPKLEHAREVWKGDANSVKQLETVRMLDKNILGCSSKTGTTVFRAELGTHSLKTKRDVKKLKWQYRVSNTSDKMLPDTFDKAVREKITKERAGIKWNNGVKKIWKDLGGDHEWIVSLFVWRGQYVSKRNG